MSYTLRPTTPADLPALTEVHEAAFRPLVETRYTWDPELQRGHLEDGFADALVIEVDGELAGELRLEERPGELFLKRIMLLPRFQGRGLGREIIEDLIARGAPVTLSVWDNNRARSLYERLGFQVTGQNGFRIQMRRDPGPASTSA